MVPDRVSDRGEQMTFYHSSTKTAALRGWALRVWALGVGSLTLALALGLASPTLAANVKAKRAAAFQAVLDCRATTDGPARLACFDAAASSLDQAETKGDIVVIDREQATTARKQAFGFELPSLAIFDKVMPKEDLDKVTVTLKEAYRSSDGKWIMVLEDGAVWRQIDSENPFNAPRAGSSVKIRRAALGSFFLNIDGQTAIRAQRSR